VKANVKIAELKLVGLLRVIDKGQQRRLPRAELRLKHVLEARAARGRAVRQDLEVAYVLEPCLELVQIETPEKLGRDLAASEATRQGFNVAHQ
jgi:hypothetical protein